MTSHTGLVLYSAFLFVHYSVALSRIFTCSVWDILYFRMAESLLEQIEALEENIAKQTAGAASGCHAAKDLSLVALILEFTGRPGDLRMNE